MKYVTIILMFLLGISAEARTLTIKVLNTPTINVGGHKMTVGDSFDETSKIFWESERQAMKVLSEDNKLYVASKKAFAKTNSSSFSDYLTNTKSASVRGDEKPMSLKDHQSAFQQDFILLDELCVETGWKVDDNNYFIAMYIMGDETCSKKIPVRDNTLIFSRELIRELTGGTIDDVTLSILYYEKDYDETTKITDSMKIEVCEIP